MISFMQPIDPELAAVVGPVGPPAPGAEPERIPTIAEARAYDEQEAAVFIADQKSQLPPESAYTVEDRKVPVDGAEITVRCIVPATTDEAATFPVLVNIHGGGWFLGSIDVDDFFLRRLSVDLKVSIVNVGYRLSPEHLFPIPLEDCFTALKWTVSNAHLLKADLTKGFIIGGHSAGANMTAVLAHQTRDDPFFQGPGRQLTGQFIREPLVIYPGVYPEEIKPEMRSMEENQYMPPLTRERAELCIAIYNPIHTDPRFSALLYPSHRGLARAFIQGMELDVVRDDARIYAKTLREAGVECRYIEYPGVSHGFHYIWPKLKAAVKVREDLVQGIKWLLGKESEA